MNANIQKILNRMTNDWSEGLIGWMVSGIYDGVCTDEELLELHKMGKSQLNIVLQEALMKDIPKTLEEVHKTIEDQVANILDNKVYEYNELQETKKKLEEHNKFIASLSKDQLAMFNKIGKRNKPKGKKKATRYDIY